MEMGKKKTVWFNERQLEQILEIQKVTGESISLIVRKGMELYQDSTKGN